MFDNEKFFSTQDLNVGILISKKVKFFSKHEQITSECIFFYLVNTQKKSFKESF